MSSRTSAFSSLVIDSPSACKVLTMMSLRSSRHLLIRALRFLSSKGFMTFRYWWVLDMGAASSLFMLEFISGEDSIPLSLRSMVALLLLKCCMSVIIFDVFWCNEVMYNCSVQESGNKWIFMCGFELLLGEKRKGGMLQDLKRVVRRTVSKAAEKRQNKRKTFVVLNYFFFFSTISSCYISAVISAKCNITCIYSTVRHFGRRFLFPSYPLVLLFRGFPSIFQRQKWSPAGRKASWNELSAALK